MADKAQTPLSEVQPPCPNCGHADYGYGQEQGYVICSECDCGDPTNMVGPHVYPAPHPIDHRHPGPMRSCKECQRRAKLTEASPADPFAVTVYGMPRAEWDAYGLKGTVRA